MQFISAEQVAEALPMTALVEALRAAFVAGAEVPLRHTHVLPGGKSLIMPAWNDRYYGVKTVNIFPNNAKLGLPGLHSTYILYDLATGAPLAQLDGDTITNRRTAAAAALGADYLAPRSAQTLLVVGAGRVASLVPEAMLAVRPSISRINVYNHRPAGAEALVAKIRAMGIHSEVVDGPEALAAAVAQADIVSCATLSEVPLIKAEWLAPHAHLDLIGSFAPNMIEADPACFANAAVYVDTDEAAGKAGDLLEAFKAGTLTKEDIRSGLAGLCQGSSKGRESDEGRTVFKAVGTALEDLASAVLVYEQSKQ